LARVAIDTVTEIDTPEHLAFVVRVAGPARRALAWFIDLLLRGLLLAFAWGLATAMFGGLDLTAVAHGLTLVAYFALNWGYFVAAELLTAGRSPGKLICGLRVVRSDGLPVTFRESALRNLARAVDVTGVPPSVIIPVAPVVMALDKSFRRLGDMLAGTIVVYERAESLSAGAALEPDPEIVEGLPRILPLDHDDLAALDVFVHRPAISAARREELAEVVAPLYAGRLGQPPPRSATKFLASLWARAQDPTARTRR